jgi:uncharacterized membrane protein YphA (DoxX/SURF4 family)
MKKFFLMVGRIGLSLYFIVTMVNIFLDWDVSHQVFIDSLCNWLNSPTLSAPLVKIFHLLLSLSWLCLVAGVILLGAGALLVLLGMKVRLGAALLICALLPATLIMDAFWLYPDGKEAIMMQFFKNLSLLGGLLILISADGVAE